MNAFTIVRDDKIAMWPLAKLLWTLVIVVVAIIVLTVVVIMQRPTGFNKRWYRSKLQCMWRLCPHYV